MFDDQTSNNVWWSNILPFGHLVWRCLLMAFDAVWSSLNSIKHSIKQHQTFLLSSCLFGDVWFVLPGVSNMFGSRMRDALSQLASRWNCGGTLGNFVAYNSLRSDVRRCLIKHVWTVWPGFQTSKCLITRNNVWWCSVVTHFPFGQGLTKAPQKNAKWKMALQRVTITSAQPKVITQIETLSFCDVLMHPLIMEICIREYKLCKRGYEVSWDWRLPVSLFGTLPTKQHTIFLLAKYLLSEADEVPMLTHQNCFLLSTCCEYFIKICRVNL